MSESRSNTNEFKKIETRQISESNSAILVSVNMDDPETASGFVKDAMESIKLQCMVSAPSTDMLCVSLIGRISAREFAAYWNEHAAADVVASTLMQKMRVADVIHGTARGELLEKISLLDRTS
jgi:hypothetical protein